MHDRDPNLLKRLLDRLLVTRARRDREARFTDAWEAADDELHEIERAIFRAPVETPESIPSRRTGRTPPRSPRAPGAYRGAGSRA
jgi:hypothetical protein